MARKVVGVGSVGTRAWIVLMLGRDDGIPCSCRPRRPRRRCSSRTSARAGTTTGGAWSRVSASCRPPATSSWAGTASRVPTGSTRDFYVRQLRDWKGSCDLETMTPRSMAVYGGLCGWTLPGARALGGPGRHRGVSRRQRRVRPGHREFSEAYADQNERDYDALQAAVKARRRSMATFDV